MRAQAFVGTVIGLGLAAAIASTATATPRLNVRVLQPTLRHVSGGSQVITVGARTTANAICAPSVVVYGRRTSLRSAETNSRGRVAWRWMILSTSPSGKWTLRVACSRGHQRGVGAISFRVHTHAGPHSGAIGDPQSEATVVGSPAGKGGGVCGPFEPGQCTCLAYQKRSDVYYTAIAHGVPAGGTRAAGPTFYQWDGEQWLVNAQRGGIPTGSVPVPGALVVWGVPNSAAYGHVAYVEAATSPTHVLVSECNWDWKGDCRTIWENPQAVPSLQGYVYGGPAGNGPTTGGGGGSSGESGGPGPGSPFTPIGSGGWETAFESNSGELWGVGADNRGALRLGMMPGTSPSITALSTGGWETAFQANNGELWLVGSDDRGAMHLGMKPGTSPSITAMPGGSWETAFQANDGRLWVIGADNRGALELGMMPGTSPSITALSTGGWETAFQANNGELWLVGSDDRGAMHLGMKPGTSPSITAMPGGSWETAFQANDGRLWVIGADNRGALELGMAPETSPSITRFSP